MKARCQQGWLIVSDDAVRTEMGAVPGSGGGTFAQNRIPRSQITGVAAKVAAMSLFGWGGAMHITIHGLGTAAIHATMVTPMKAARAVLTALGQ